ncbi:hypothetical protein AGMMS4957_03920 [Bacteroidia bacterium]|nr:hypothetical protein AGMMS4957_03920 [Bacteroidia bacterium]
MNKKIAICLLISIALVGMQGAYAQTTLKERLEKHVYTLADDSLRGRKAGSEYARKAAEYVVAQWKEIGIEPYQADNYFQPFIKDESNYRNIIGILRGNDPTLSDEYIVVGAHYDHIGVKTDDNGNTKIYNGADDNASGVATITEMARRLKEKQGSLRRSIILIAFDGEELGLYGSRAFVKNPIVPLEKIRLMLSVDMVGWYKTSGYVKYQGSGTIAGGKNLLLDAALTPNGLHVTTQSFENSVLTATDTEAFAKQGIPTLAVTTGLKSPYHKPEDDADLIDYDGMVLITEHLTSLVQHVSEDADYRASGKVAKKHRYHRNGAVFGLSANIGSNNHYYTGGAVNGKPGGAYGIGLMAQYEWGVYAIRSEAFYDYVTGKHPGGTIKTNAITIPVSFVLQTPRQSVGVDAFFGGYYSHKFSGKQGDKDLDYQQDFYRNEGGLNLGAGLHFGDFKIGYNGRIALTNFTRHKNVDNAHLQNYAFYLTLTYLF